MNQNFFYEYMQKQVILLMVLSLGQGAAFTLLCWMNDVFLVALIWYGFVNLVCIWGWSLYLRLNIADMTFEDLDNWYLEVRLFMYVIFSSWTIIFIFYVQETQGNLHYVTIFSQLFMSIIASTFLGSDTKIFVPVLIILMYPLLIYFALIGFSYGYFLSISTALLLGVLLYASNKSNGLIQQVYYEAQGDALTGLYNRRYFLVYLDKLINSLRKNKSFGYILLIDLDYFKTINDSLGHKIGDSLLIKVAERIVQMCGDTHLVARLGGDEFIIASDDYENEDICMQKGYEFAEKLRLVLKNTYEIEHHRLFLSASIGISLIANARLNANEVIKEADIAMYAVKEQERDGVVLFNAELKKKVDMQLEMERRLRFSIQNNEIELKYQPQFNSEKRIVGVEVLVRWHNSMLGHVSPVDFIQIAEKTGFIIELGTYILEESFRTLKDWDSKGIELDHFSINISVKQFLHISFLDDVKVLCQKYLTYKIRKKVIFEVTETLFAEDIDRIIVIMDALKDFGISFSMDDFGTGYSSLSNLKELPVNELKIDQVFVSGIGQDLSDEMMLIMILSMKTIFDVDIVAEGIETKEQYEFLLDNGCAIFQGYYFSKPVDKEEFEALKNAE